MKHWNMVLVLVALLLLPAMPASAFAQDGAALSLSLSADKSSAAVGDNVTYTYLISSTGNVTVDNVTLLDSKLGQIALSKISLTTPGDNVTAFATYTVVQADLPGPLATSANVTGTAPNGEVVVAASNSVSVALTTSSDNNSPPQVMTKAQILKARGVPGKGIATAPGLQKPFNPNSNAAKKLQGFMERLTLRENAEVKVKNKAKNK
ncbi:MAG: hypothetical protein FJ008_09920 [Chloroflexi bacterium]|nr:hypothetical protein [Chloroflexota bacterium]MBM4450804.1 hypothetical protein [Chloroflexota bacterium]